MTTQSEPRETGAGQQAGPVRVSTVAPGVLVATEALPWARAVALSATVLAGSVDERPEEAGAAHLIEHLLFRGSSRYGAGAVDRLFDDLGADLSATTDRCQTQLSTWVMAADAPLAVDAISDVLWRPTIAPSDVAQEREIVLEELSMIEDSPEDLTFDLVGDALFPDSPLGRPVIGRRDTITALTPEALAGFHRARYAVAPVVWVAVGAVDHDALCEQVLADLPEWRDPAAPAPSAELRAPVVSPPRRLVVERPSEQVHVALAVPLGAVHGERRMALQILDALIGGPPSSRLFQEVRERRGLAYSVSSFLEVQQGFGAFGAYVGTRPERVSEAMTVIAAELRAAASGGVTDEEVAWARRHVAGRVGLSAETAGGRAGLLAGRLAAGQPIVDAATLSERVGQIDRAAVSAMAAEVLGALDAAAVAVVAPKARPISGLLDQLALGPAAG